MNLNDWMIRGFVEAAAMRHRPIHRAIDVGSGDGRFRALLGSLATECLSLDIRAQGPVDVIADAQKLPLMSGCGDFVICCEVIEHVEDLEAAIDELVRVTASGGSIILTWPFLYPLHELPNDFRRMSPFWVHVVAGRKGLDVVQLVPRGDWMSVLLELWRGLLTGAFHALGRVGRGAWLLQIIGGLSNFMTSGLTRVERWRLKLPPEGPSRPEDWPALEVSKLAALDRASLGYCAWLRKR